MMCLLTFRETAHQDVPLSLDVTKQKNCPVCDRVLSNSGADAFTIMTGRGRRNWQRCTACKSYFDTTSYDLNAEAENTQRHSYGRRAQGLVVSEHKRRLYRTVLDLADKFACKGASLLDVGSSYGGLLTAARQRGYTAVGADIVDDAIEYVRAQGFTCFDVASAQWRDIPDDAFDVITVLDCNYYWAKQREELLTIYRRLRPGGILVMRTVDKSWLLSLGLCASRLLPHPGQKLCWRAVNDHRVSIPAPSLTALLQSVGFELRYASPRGAIQSDGSSRIVKLFFWLGSVVWFVTGFNVAPGFLIVAAKTGTLTSPEAAVRRDSDGSKCARATATDSYSTLCLVHRP